MIRLHHFTPNAKTSADNGFQTRKSQPAADETAALIEEHAALLPLDVPTIEPAGGSVRCMIAGIYLIARVANRSMET